MRSTQIIRFIVGIGLVLPVAYAQGGMNSVFLEPDAGYALAGKLGPSGSSKDSFSGLSLGGRLGLRLGKVLMIGASSKYLPSIRYVDSGSSTALSTNPSMLTLGGFVGLHFSRIRIWGGYNFMDSINNMTFTDPTLGTATIKFSGTSYFAGIGFRVIHLIYLNGEYVVPTYTKVSGSMSGISINQTLSPNVNGSYGVISISAPFHL